MLEAEQLEYLRKVICESARPLVFFDDDADGLTSYLLVRNANSDAKGLRAARGPELTHHFIGFVRRESPDQVLILDKPMVSEEFLEQVTTPTLWLDHHDPQGFTQHKSYGHLTYLNPLLQDSTDNRPTSYWVQQALNGPLWLATAGTVSDWDTSYIEAFREKYPELAPETNHVHDALYNSKLGEIIRILNFCLKGTTRQIDECVEALTHIKEPQELLEGKTHAANHIQRHVKPILDEYHKQFQAAQQGENKNGVYVYVFDSVDTSLVTNVANEMLTKTETEVLIIGRKEKDRVNFSMRSKTEPINTRLEKALAQVDGYGGGHEHACGGSVRETDWQRFIELLTQ